MHRLPPIFILMIVGAVCADDLSGNVPQEDAYEHQSQRTEHLRKARMELQRYYDEWLRPKYKARSEVVSVTPHSPMPSQYPQWLTNPQEPTPDQTSSKSRNVYASRSLKEMPKPYGHDYFHLYHLHQPNGDQASWAHTEPQQQYSYSYVYGKQPVFLPPCEQPPCLETLQPPQQSQPVYNSYQARPVYIKYQYDEPAYIHYQLLHPNNLNRPYYNQYYGTQTYNPYKLPQIVPIPYQQLQPSSTNQETDPSNTFIYNRYPIYQKPIKPTVLTKPTDSPKYKPAPTKYPSYQYHQHSDKYPAADGLNELKPVAEEVPPILNKPIHHPGTAQLQSGFVASNITTPASISQQLEENSTTESTPVTQIVTGAGETAVLTSREPDSTTEETSRITSTPPSNGDYLSTTEESFLITSTRPSNGDDLSTTEESFLITSTSPSKVDDLSATEKSFLITSTSPSNGDDLSTTEESFLITSTSPSNGDDLSTTEESFLITSTSPSKVDDLSATEKSFLITSTSPSNGDDLSTTEESFLITSTSPSNGDDLSTTEESFLITSTSPSKGDDLITEILTVVHEMEAENATKTSRVVGTTADLVTSAESSVPIPSTADQTETRATSRPTLFDVIEHEEGSITSAYSGVTQTATDTHSTTETTVDVSTRTAGTTHRVSSERPAPLHAVETSVSPIAGKAEDWIPSSPILKRTEVYGKDLVRREDSWAQRRLEQGKSSSTIKNAVMSDDNRISEDLVDIARGQKLSAESVEALFLKHLIHVISNELRGGKLSKDDEENLRDVFGDMWSRIVDEAYNGNPVKFSPPDQAVATRVLRYFIDGTLLARRLGKKSLCICKDFRIRREAQNLLQPWQEDLLRSVLSQPLLKTEVKGNPSKKALETYQYRVILKSIQEQINGPPPLDDYNYTDEGQVGDTTEVNRNGEYYEEGEVLERKSGIRGR